MAQVSADLKNHVCAQEGSESGQFSALTRPQITEIYAATFSNGDILYVGENGGLTNTSGTGAVGIVAHASSDGIIIVEAKGNGTWGALKAGLS